MERRRQTMKKWILTMTALATVHALTGCGRAADKPVELHADIQHVTDSPAWVVKLPEIGRASCRERV